MATDWNKSYRKKKGEKYEDLICKNRIIQIVSIPEKSKLVIIAICNQS